MSGGRMVRCFLILNSLWSVETTYPSCMAKKLSGLECHPLHNCLPGLQQNQLIRLEWPKWCMANKTVYNTGNVTSIWQTGSVGRFVPRAKGVEVIHFPLHSLLHLPFWHGVVLDFAFGGIIRNQAVVSQIKESGSLGDRLDNELGHCFRNLIATENRAGLETVTMEDKQEQSGRRCLKQREQHEVDRLPRGTRIFYCFPMRTKDDRLNWCREVSMLLIEPSVRLIRSWCCT